MATLSDKLQKQMKELVCKTWRGFYLHLSLYIILLDARTIGMEYCIWHTDKKEKKIFLISREIQSGAVAKSYIRNGFLIQEEMQKCFPIYEEAVSHI